MQKSLKGLGSFRKVVATSLATEGVNSGRKAIVRPPKSLKAYIRKRTSSPAFAAKSS
jgi:hypothetical protein